MAIPQLQYLLMDANLGLVEGDFYYCHDNLHVVVKFGVFDWLKENYEHYDTIDICVSSLILDWNGVGKVCFKISFAGRIIKTPAMKS